MRSSNTSPEGRRPQHRTHRWLLAVIAAACLVDAAQALDPNRAISQYIRDQWGLEQGFPGGAVYAIAETRDGYLWIGAEKGLVRFDGLNFLLFDHDNTPAFPASPVLGLTADAEGNLWIRLQSPDVLRYHDGTFSDALPDSIHPDAGVTAMCRGAGGEVLMARPSGTLRYTDGKLATLPFTAGRANLLVISIAETDDGELWMGTRDAGLFSLSETQDPHVVQGLPDRKINSLLPVGGGELWIGTDNGVVRWDGGNLARVTHGLEHIQALAMTKDRESNIWIGAASGLLRVNAAGVAALQEPDRRSRAVTALVEDREGDLWAGGAEGIERFRDSAFLTYSLSPGLSSENEGPLYADEQGRTWFAPSAGGLFWLQGARTGRVTEDGLDTDVVYSITGGPGELWLGRQRGGLTRLHLSGGSFTAETFTEADGLAQNSVYAVHRSRDGTVWAGTLSGGVSRFRNGGFTTFTTKNGLGSNTITAIAESFNGTMWFATPSGLSALSNDRWRVYTGADGLPPGNLNSLFADSNGVLWIGSGAGLAFLRDGVIQTPSAMPASLQEQILGLTEDRFGSLWIATSKHVLRVNRDKLLRNDLAAGDSREFGTADGLPGTEGVKRHRSVVGDSMGRVWVSTNRGISVVDPARLTAGSAPAIVHIEAIAADGSAIDLRNPVRIPAGPRRITFGYVGQSLSIPERVRFRYTLDGFDRGWSAAVATREAAYTNLGPGSYRFRVIASNPDGVWNSSEAAIAFEIEPAFWQTWWFVLSAMLAGLLSMFALYRFRLHQMARQLHVRFEERLAERTRIAQELHDTLLQGFLSASMQLHVTVDSLPAESPAKPPLSRILQLMAQVMEEGRNAVRGLRSHGSTSHDLEQAFSRIPDELATREQAEFRVVVEGRPRPLHPVIHDEVYFIGREALVNAFRHAQARAIEVELEYGASHLRILVRDNGCGIDPEVLRSGREGHWGLSGIRERAERIGARLRVWSRAAAGTEVELSVPSHIAFPAQSEDRPRKWFGGQDPRKAAATAQASSERKK